MHKMKNFLQLLFLSIILLINLGTLCYCAPLKENLSYLGNTLGHRFYLLLWAASAAFYFLQYTRKLMHHYHYTHPLGWLLLYLTCSLMIASVTLPYDPQQYPIASKWHTRIAMWATIGYVLLFFHFLFDIMKKDYPFFNQAFTKYLLLVVFDSLLFLLNGGVSTLLEITFTIGMSMLLYQCTKNISTS